VFEKAAGQISLYSRERGRRASERAEGGDSNSLSLIYWSILKLVFPRRPESSPDLDDISMRSTCGTGERERTVRTLASRGRTGKALRSPLKKTRAKIEAD
jgi:hypothetical protein